MGFADIRGHDRAVAVLRRAWQSGHLGHAYLFAGPEGIGKERLAVALFQYVNCRATSDDACGACTPCRCIEQDATAAREPAGNDVESGLITWSFPDVHILRRTGQFIRIEQVRELMRCLPYPPVSGRLRCVLVRNAHELHPTAANALLKTLEEPTSNTLIVLVTHAPHLLLPTIRSRCQTVTLTQLDREAVAAVLGAMREDLEPTASRVLASMSDGSPGRALELADSRVVADRPGWLRQLAALDGAAPVDVLRFAETLAERSNRDALPLLLHLMRLWYHDVLLLQEGVPDDRVVNLDLLADAREAARRSDRNASLARLDLVSRAERALRGNANVGLTTDWLCLHLARHGR